MSWLPEDVHLHPLTHKQVVAQLASPKACYLLVAEDGQGSVQIQTAAANKWHALMSFAIDLREGGGGMEEVRAMRTSLQTSSGQHRIVAIYAANRLSHEAQNALLKILEEAPAKTTFILHAKSDSGILPTIKSRAGTITFMPLDKSSYIKALTKQASIDEATASNLYFMSAGVFDHELDSSDAINNYVSQFDSAKKFLAASESERFSTIEKMIKDEAPLDRFIKNLASTIRAAQSASGAQGNTKAAKLWAIKLQIVEQLLTAFEKNANKKLLMANLVVKL